MYKKNKFAFTLVELIVVITILAMLSTIAFVSYGSYASRAKDTSRTYTIGEILKGSDLFNISTGKTPLPDNNVAIYLSGNIIGYQGIVGPNMARLINLTNYKDPDGLNYDYYTDNKNGQVLGYLNNSTLSYLGEKSYADDYSKKYPITGGKSLGMLIKRDSSKSPINEIYTGSIYVDSGSNIRQNFISYNYGAENQLICPDGYVEVPGNPLYKQNAFCVMKYEAKIKGQDDGLYLFTNASNTGLFTQAIPESRSSGTPWINITQNDAISKCASIGSGYHLITNNEWMALAGNIETNDKNWTGGKYGVGLVYYGNNAGTMSSIYSGSTNDTNGYANFTYSTGVENKRTLYLSNGNIVWDFAGNVREMTSDLIQTSKIPNSANPLDDIREYSTTPAHTNSNITFNSSYLTDINPGTISPSGFNSKNGIGGYYYYVTSAGKTNNCLSYSSNDCISTFGTNSAYIRGGGCKSGNTGGIYGANFAYSENAYMSNVGFRCVYGN